MARLDRRTAAAERRGHIRSPVVEPQPIPAELWRAIRRNKQNYSAHQVRQLVQKFMEFMAHYDYPSLQTAMIPISQWWWPLQVSTCKAVWKLVDYRDDDAKSHLKDSAAYKLVGVNAAVYLIASTGQLVYMESVRFDRGRPQVTFRKWDGEFADQVVQAMDTIAQQYSS